MPGASSALQLCPPPLYLWCWRPAGAKCETTKKKRKKRERGKKNCFTLIFCLSASLLHLLTIQQSGSGRQHWGRGGAGGVGWKLSKERVRVRGWHGHQGPCAEQMSATTCFLTPVRVLVTPRMQPAEKFMTLEVSCPPSKTAALPPHLPRCLASPPSAASLLSPRSSPHHRCPLCHLHLTSHRTVQTPLTLIKSSLSVQQIITRVSHWGAGWRGPTTVAEVTESTWALKKTRNNNNKRKRNMTKGYMNNTVSYTQLNSWMQML